MKTKLILTAVVLAVASFAVSVAAATEAEQPAKSRSSASSLRQNGQSSPHRFSRSERNSCDSPHRRTLMSRRSRSSLRKSLSFGRISGKSAKCTARLSQSSGEEPAWVLRALARDVPALAPAGALVQVCDRAGAVQPVPVLASAQE
jgi:hypothetical protein